MKHSARMLCSFSKFYNKVSVGYKIIIKPKVRKKTLEKVHRRKSLPLNYKQNNSKNNNLKLVFKLN